MTRLVSTMFVLVFLLSQAAVAQRPSAGVRQSLELGKTFDAEIAGETKWLGGAREVNLGPLYHYEVPIRLKAGQPISISCTVTGQNRNVVIVLLDPKGRAVNHSDKTTKAAALHIEEVAASGLYTIMVASDQIGLCKLRAVDPTVENDENDASIQALEEKRDRLKKELAEVETKLINALKAKAK